MTQNAIQDYYSERFSHCYGCGRLNDHGHQIKSYWDEEKQESSCSFQPLPEHTALPGFVYGGLIASLIDCHGTGTAAAAAYQAEGRKMGTDPQLRFVTASLKVDYLKPTPITALLNLKGKPTEVKERKVIVEVTVSADKEICAKGVVIAVKVPESFLQDM